MRSAALTSADRFNVIQFDSTTSSLYFRPVPFSPARRMRRRSPTSTGSRPTAARRSAPRSTRPSSQPAMAGYVRQVIFITDGAVSSETALFAAIEQRLGDARLFTVGIGSAPNSYFMRKAAQFGRGTYTHIGDVGRRHREDDGLVRQARARRAQQRRRRLARGRRALSARDTGSLRRRAARGRGELSGGAGSAAADDGVRPSGAACPGARALPAAPASCPASLRCGRAARSST